MAPRAVVRFVENEKCNLFHVHEAVDQCIQEQLMGANNNIHVSQGVVPRALLIPPIDPVDTRERSALKRWELSGDDVVLLLHKL